MPNDPLLEIELSEGKVDLDDHRLEMAMKRIAQLMQTGYLPRNLTDDLQIIMNAATAWQITVEERAGAEE
ncbi:MAG TPA: hypothetical protein VH593_10810 [Ktedonobacteraceae bacterium]|jgi:hypothetical protein